MKKQLLFLVLMLLPMLASADPVEIDGIYYNLITENKTAEVTSNPNKYSDEVVIPSSVTYNDVEYSVTSIGYQAFYSCSSLTSITIPNSVTSIGGYAFDGTAWYNNQPDGLVYAGKVAYKYKGDMPENTKIILNDGTLGIANGAFGYCSSLTSITIPNSVTSIGGGAFSWCTSLTSITIPNSVTSIGDHAFVGCTSLTSITIPNSVTSIGGDAFSGCTSLTSITIPNSVTSIGAWAFDFCTSLTSITIPNSVTSIGVCAFGGCSSLTSIIVESGNTVYDSRKNCNAIIETSTNRMIAGCKNTIIPNSVTTIGISAFSGCSITSITIPNSVTSIGDYAFYKCTSLTSITIPNSVTSIGISAFSDCSITSITIPNSVTSIGDEAFSWCTSLTSITIPNSVTSIGNYAFSGCSSLTSITIPNSVTSIGKQAFDGCSSLTSVTIPNSVKSIDERAFEDCSGLQEVKVLASTPPFAYDNTFSNYNIPLYAPEESISDYQSTNPWSKFASFNTLSGETIETPKCATPTISYDDDNKKLTFGCETEGVEYVYSIKDTDIKQGYDAEVTLTATYEISVYATKAGYENSDVATATLVWGSATFTDTTPATAIEMVPAMEAAMPVLIQNNGGMLTVQGAQDGTPVSVYTIAGTEAGSAVSQNSCATISTSMQQGDIAIIKIGERSIKVVLK